MKWRSDWGILVIVQLEICCWKNFADDVTISLRSPLLGVSIGAYAKQGILS